MIHAIGAGVGSDFDIEDSNYDKVIIMTDADVDGAHIRTLLLTLFYRYFKPLIENGHIYLAKPPLYKITRGKDEYIYLKNDAELEKFREANKGKKYTVNRLKGLGEMSVEETEILTDPAQRIIKQITVEDVKKADKLFDDLMGDAVVPRKMFIKEHSNKATYQI